MKFRLIISAILVPVLLTGSTREVATIQFVDGVVRIKPSSEEAVESVAIPGRVIYEDDVLQTAENAVVELVTKDLGLRIKLAEMTEISIEENNIFRSIHLQFGRIFTESRTETKKDSYISTPSSKVKLGNSETWIYSNYSGEDEIYVLEGEVIARNKTLQNRKSIRIGEMVFSGRAGMYDKDLIVPMMLPEDIYIRLELNLAALKDEEPFSDLHLFQQDLIPMVSQYEEEKPSGDFGFTLEAGVTIVEDIQYTKANIIPAYQGSNFQFGYNLEGYINSADTVRDLNTFADFFEILDRMTVFQFENSPETFRFKMGQINNLTYGYGMLLKNYTNSISYPLKRDVGLELDYHTDSKNYTFHLFTSSLRDLSNSGGLMGMYSSMKLSPSFPLRIGLGYMADLNQFAALRDSLWEDDFEPLERKVSAFQLDLTYQLYSGFRNDMYLFGELASLNFPETLHYLRPEEIAGAGSDIQELGISRKGTFSFLGPGIWLKLGHHKNLKLAFNYSSPLNLTQYFGETYNLERVHYVSFDLDSIQNEANEPYAEFESWLEMINSYANDDISELYLSKDMYPLLDPTKNVYNKIGLTTEYTFNYRDQYNYSFEASFYKEIGDADHVETFYTTGLDIQIKDGVIKGISELDIFFKQYYTRNLFGISTPDENMLMGARVGIKLFGNFSARIHLKDVFYDRDYDGETDLNRTAGVELVARF